MGGRDARRSMWALSQEPRDEGDPAVTLAFLAQRLFAGVPVLLHLHLQECARLASQIRLALVRIGKEALTNALKHSGATTVRVRLVRGKKEVRLSVLDNGRGFADLALGQGGFGLFGLRARAEHLGGKVTVLSRPGRGTRVVATVPI